MKYKIVNDDCMDFMATIPDNSVDLIVTDPPYKVTSRGSAGNSGGMLQKKINRSGQVFKHNNMKMADYMPELYRILKEGSHFYIMTNHVNLHEMITVAKETGFHFTKSLIWMKNNKIMGQAYMGQFEYILFLRKGKFKKINNCGTSDIIAVDNNKTKGEDGKNIHDTEKPVELMKVLIENSSDKNDIIFDPFMGVGSTVLAAIESGRRGIGVELDEEYYNIAQNRINEQITNSQIL